LFKLLRLSNHRETARATQTMVVPGASVEDAAAEAEAVADETLSVPNELPNSAFR
jgi:hypothetical protein